MWKKKKNLIFFMDSRKFTNQEKQAYYLVYVEHNGMATHITRSNRKVF